MHLALCRTLQVVAVMKLTMEPILLCRSWLPNLQSKAKWLGALRTPYQLLLDSYRGRCWSLCCSRSSISTTSETDAFISRTAGFVIFLKSSFGKFSCTVAKCALTSMLFLLFFSDTRTGKNDSVPSYNLNIQLAARKMEEIIILHFFSLFPISTQSSFFAINISVTTSCCSLILDNTLEGGNRT